MSKHRFTFAGIDQSVFIAGALLVVAVFVTAAINRFIPAHFPVRPIVPDLLFELTPNLAWTQYVADAVVVISPIVALLYLTVFNPRTIPFAIVVVSLAELARAALMALTPLGPSFAGMQYGLTNYPQYGQFPSGHTVVVVAAALTAITRPSRLTLWTLAVIEMASLLLSHGHYSIDIAGGVLVAYSTYTLVQPLRQQLVVPDSN